MGDGLFEEFETAGSVACGELGFTELFQTARDPSRIAQFHPQVERSLQMPNRFIDLHVLDREVETDVAMYLGLGVEVDRLRKRIDQRQRLAKISNGRGPVATQHLCGMSGLDVCRRLRAEGARVPIIMLTAKSDTIDVVVGLELGADDYVTKPFEVRELMARIGAHLRRSEISAQEQPRDRFEFPGLTIDLGRRQVFRDGEEVMLTLTEFNLLALLASRPGQVMSRGELLRRVWGYEVEIETRTVDAHVYRLRRKIEPDAEKPTYIHSVPGIGYRFSG